MTPLPAKSSLPAGQAGDVTVIRVSTGTPRKRTFASPFRSGRQAATPESTHDAEPDPLAGWDSFGEPDDAGDAAEPGTALTTKAGATTTSKTRAAAKSTAAKASATPKATRTRKTPASGPVTVIREAAPATAPEPAPDAAHALTRQEAIAPTTTAASLDLAAPSAHAAQSAAEVDEPGLDDAELVALEAALDAELDAELAAAGGADDEAALERMLAAAATPAATEQAPIKPPASSPARPAMSPLSPVAPVAPRLRPEASAPAPEAPAVVLSDAELALHSRGADAAAWLGGRVGQPVLAALAEANRALMGLTPSKHAAKNQETAHAQAHQRAAAVLLHHGFSLDKRQPGVRTAFSATVGANSGGPLAVFVIESGAVGDTRAATHAAAVLGGALGLAAVAPGLGLSVRVLGVPGGEGNDALETLLREGFVDGATLVVAAREGERAEVGTNAPADRQWDVVFSAKEASVLTLGGDAADALELARLALGLAQRHVPEGVVVETSGFAAPEGSAGLRVRLHGDSPDLLDATADRVQACLEAAVTGTGTRMRRTARHDAGTGLRQDAVLVGAYRAAANRRGNQIALAEGTVASAGLGIVSQKVPTLHPSVPQGESTADVYAMLDAAYGLAIAAAAGCLAGTAR